MTRPAPLFGAARLHVLDSDTTTSLGYVSGADAQGTHSKAFSESSLSFTANALEDLLVSDETALEGAFVVPEVWYDSDWMAFGTPYMLTPGSGTVIGPGEKIARAHTPVAVGALSGLLEECIVLPSECDPDSPTFKRAGGLEQNRYLDFTSKHYSLSLHSWHACDVYDPTGHKKAGKPSGWHDTDAEWVFRDAAEGGRTCFVFRNIADSAYTFTLADPQRVVIESVSDENHKIFLDGPNQGGCVIDFSGDEDGFNQGAGHWSQRLAAGTYRISAWMLTVDSVGGDGNDSIRMSCWSVATDGSGDLDAYLMRSDENTQVLRQEMSEELPGMSPGEVMRRLLDECSDQGSEAADLLLANRTFTDTLDTAGDDWTYLGGWVWPLGTSLASAFSDMLTEIDLDMGVEFSFDAWEDRTEDVSATVILKPGADPPTADMNLLGYTYESDPGGPNALLMDCQDGLVLYAPTPVSGQRRKFGQGESGGASSIAAARRNARKAIEANEKPRRHYVAEFIPVTNAVPWVDFTVTFLVNGRGYRNLGLDLEVTSLSWEQGEAVKVTATLSEPT